MSAGDYFCVSRNTSSQMSVTTSELGKTTKEEPVSKLWSECPQGQKYRKILIRTLIFSLQNFHGLTFSWRRMFERKMHCLNTVAYLLQAINNKMCATWPRLTHSTVCGEWEDSNKTDVDWTGHLVAYRGVWHAVSCLTYCVLPDTWKCSITEV
jgi:hypothetical protein